jgi:hypothetical protein
MPTNGYDYQPPYAVPRNRYSDPAQGSDVGSNYGSYSPPYIGGAGDPNQARLGGVTGGVAPAMPMAPDRSAVQSMIAQWQQSHNPAEGVGGLADALKAQFGIERWKYGNTPSGNEINLGGERYKLLGGEGTSNAYWYQPGMDDSGPQGQPGDGMLQGTAQGTYMPGYGPGGTPMNGTAPGLPGTQSLSGTSYGQNSIGAMMRGQQPQPGSLFGRTNPYEVYQPPYLSGGV